MTADSDDATESTFSSEVGQRLRSVRRIRGLSLDDVERESGGRWSASAVGAYERGFRNLSLPRLRDLAMFYDVPMGVLLGEDEGGDGAGPRAGWCSTSSRCRGARGRGGAALPAVDHPRAG